MHGAGYRETHHEAIVHSASGQPKETRNPVSVGIGRILVHIVPCANRDTALLRPRINMHNISSSQPHCQCCRASKLHRPTYIRCYQTAVGDFAGFRVCVTMATQLAPAALTVESLLRRVVAAGKVLGEQHGFGANVKNVIRTGAHDAVEQERAQAETREPQDSAVFAFQPAIKEVPEQSTCDALTPRNTAEHGLFGFHA